MNTDDYIELMDIGILQYNYFQILKDEEWHCRKCTQQQVCSEQLAGRGSIQGLQIGTRSRPGIVIETKSDYCNHCGKTTK